jgi:hypothetical protein
MELVSCHVTFSRIQFRTDALKAEAWQREQGVGHVGGCVQKFPDWPPGARTANGTALCH